MKAGWPSVLVPCTPPLPISQNQQQQQTGLGTVRKTVPLSLGLIGGILIVLFITIGCSDVPYTGPILKVRDVEQFLQSANESAACLQDGFDSVCIKLVGEGAPDGSGISDGPIVHVHPTSLTYVFHYEGQPILYAERGMDTSQLVQELVDVGKIQLPPGGGVWSNKTGQPKRH